MTETIDMILRTTFYYYDMSGTWTLNKKIVHLSRQGLVAELEMDIESLKGTDEDLIMAYQETINYLHNMSDREYQVIKQDFLEGTSVPD